MREWLAFHWPDIAVLAVLAWYAVDGWRRGFLALALDTIGLLLALLAAISLHRPLAELIASVSTWPSGLAQAVAFLGMWWAVGLLWLPIAGRCEERLPARWRASKVQQLLGPLPGLVHGALMAAFFLSCAVALPLPADAKRSVADAPLPRRLLDLFGGREGWLAPALARPDDGNADVLTIHVDENERVTLPFATRNGIMDAEAERAMLDLINAERTTRGLPALVSDDRLGAQARAYGREMLARGFMSHVDADGRSSADRLFLAGIPYGVTGENLAFAPDVRTAHAGLMDSPGHRANMLHPDFGRVGVGVIDVGIRGRMFVQEFTD